MPTHELAGLTVEPWRGSRIDRRSTYRGYVGRVLPRMREVIRVVDLWAVTRLLLLAWDLFVAFSARMARWKQSRFLRFYHTINCKHKTISYRIYCKYHSRWRMHNPELLSQLQLLCYATPMWFLLRWLSFLKKKGWERLFNKKNRQNKFDDFLNLKICEGKNCLME